MNKFQKTISYTTLVGAILFVPFLANAESRFVCKDLKERESKAESLFSDHVNRFDNTEENFVKEMGGEISQFEEKRVEQKKNADETLKSHLSSVSSLAKTPEQKKAVDTYTAALKNISKARANSIENAQQEYKDGVKKLFAQKKSLEKVLVSEYKESSKRAFENSLRDCENGRSVFLFKKELKQNIDASHKKFVQQLQAVSFEQSLELLKVSRNKKIQDAQNEFLRVHSPLVNTLRASLSQ